MFVPFIVLRVVENHPSTSKQNQIKTGLLRYHQERWPRLRPKGRTDMTERWLSADDIATHLGITRDTDHVWIADKDMPAHWIGRPWKFLARKADDWARTGAAANSMPRPIESSGSDVVGSLDPDSKKK